MAEMGFQATTQEWRWPVVDATEPPGVRTVRGYVTVLRRVQEHDEVRVSIFFSDAEGRPVEGFSAHDLWMFHDAAAIALSEITGQSDGVKERDIIGDIVR